MDINEIAREVLEKANTLPETIDFGWDYQDDSQYVIEANKIYSSASALARAVLAQKDEIDNLLTAHDVLKSYADWSKSEIKLLSRFSAQCALDIHVDVSDELARLREVERKAIEQSEYIQQKGLTEYEMARKDTMYALALDKIRDQEASLAALRDQLGASVELCNIREEQLLDELAEITALRRVAEKYNRIIEAGYGPELDQLEVLAGIL